MTASSRLDLVTTWGVIHVYAAHGYLTNCDLPLQPHARKTNLLILSRKLSGQTPDDRRVLQHAEQFLCTCLRGQPATVTPLLRPAVRTAFTKRVLAALQSVPHGATITYGELARRIGAPRAVRAVGTACGANPLPLFIPCHRVVAAGGKLGGFSSGLAWKMLLLAKEGVV